eukprot:CAMPEP_0114660360 /NCGR_PEP_ID=MMETSP0191-20121206/19869_1 /TAXON_ID=126664 /ORGANISM="Sorites sp." /LENGTH=228 /DNA_ID=CAMNT_0001888703 /DNA_START=390 /DNA_END=1076 /DNA_ORIENTATION=+
MNYIQEELNPELSQLRDEIALAYVDNVDTLESQAHTSIIDAVTCRVSYMDDEGIDKIVLPDKIIKDDLRLYKEYEKMFAKMVLYGCAGNQESLKLSTGVPLYMLINDFINDNDRKFVVTSAHDTTLLAILSNLQDNIMESVDNDEFEWPTYGSFIIFEVWEDQDTKQRYVKVIFDKKYIKIYNKHRLTVNELKDIWKHKLISPQDYYDTYIKPTLDEPELEPEMTQQS